MLNTGIPRSNVPAVTGKMTPEGIKATIVISSNSNQNATLETAYVITEVEPSNMTFESLWKPSALNSNGRRPPPFQQHACDIAGILNLLISDHQRATNITPLIFWLVVQCRHKIRQRFYLGTKHWKVPPWVAMADWKRAEGDVFATVEIELPPRTVKKISQFGITVEDGHSPLNANTVHLWVNCLGSLLATAKEKCDKTDEKSLGELMNHLIWIDDILSLPDVQRVFRETISLSELFTKLRGPTSLPPKKPNNQPGPEEVDADEMAAEFDELLDMSPEPGEYSGARVLRYLRTITACVRAAIAAANFCCEAIHTPEISLVQLSDHSLVAQEDVKTNGQDVIKYLQDQISTRCAKTPDIMEKASRWIKNLRDRDEDRETKLPFRVHAEAGLMALLKTVDTHSEDLPGWVQDMREMETCAIGVSKKCCYMCYLLREYMFDNVHGSPKSLHLPGSHGHVFPWDPPSFGISDEVLVKLARNLQAEAIRLAIKDASEKVSRSGQSSPTSVHNYNGIKYDLYGDSD